MYVSVCICMFVWVSVCVCVCMCVCVHVHALFFCIHLCGVLSLWYVIDFSYSDNICHMLWMQMDNILSLCLFCNNIRVKWLVSAAPDESCLAVICLIPRATASQTRCWNIWNGRASDVLRFGVTHINMLLGHSTRWYNLHSLSYN